MTDIATCAKCGKTKELCGSIRVDSIQQPRICKDCLLDFMVTGDEDTNDFLWLIQMQELGDTESLDNIKKIANGGPK